MPVYLQNQPDENTYLVIWHITENGNELMNMLNDLLHDAQTQTPRDNKHWLASRLCLQQLFPHNKIILSKDEYNKPYLKIDNVDYYISITHSFDMAAVIVSRTHPVALDLELTDKRIERVMYKFCNEDELSFLLAEQTLNQLTTIWSAKETLYKYYGKKKLDFRQHLHISPFEHKEDTYLVAGKIVKDELLVETTIQVTIINEHYVLTMIA